MRWLSCCNPSPEVLFTAVGEGDIGRVKTLLARGADANARSQVRAAAVTWRSLAVTPS